MIRAILQNIKEHKLKYSIIFTLIIIEYILTLIQPRIVNRLIDTIAQGNLTQSFLNWQLIIIALASIGAYVVSAMAAKLLYDDSNFFHYKLKNKLYRKMIHMRMPYYETFKSGDMMTRFSSDTSEVSTFLGYGLHSFVTGVGTIVFLLPAMFFISWQLTLIVCIPITIAGYIVYHISIRIDPLIEQYRESVANLSSEVLEVVEGVRVSRAYGNSELGKQKFYEKTATLHHDARVINNYSSGYGRVAFMGISISTLLLIIFSCEKLIKGQITLGEIIALQLYTTMLLDPMWMVSDLVATYQQSKVSFSKIEELLTQSDNMQKDGDVVLHAIDNITFSNYSFQYKLSHNINLNNISVTLKRGQTLGVIGKTGSGKTTLIRQFLLQYPIGQGEFNINGLPISTYQRSSVEQLIGYVPQEHVLFSKSVKENLQVGKKDADIIDIAAAIKTAAFTQDLERMSDGIDTLIGEKGVSISGGQKQRISIARAFIKQPELLILDDSLSAVDAKTESQIIDNIKQIRQDKSSIIVTHRLSAVNHADWIIVLDDGKIVEEGTPTQLYDQKGWYYEQYQKQQMEGDNV